MHITSRQVLIYMKRLNWNAVISQYFWEKVFVFSFPRKSMPKNAIKHPLVGQNLSYTSSSPVCCTRPVAQTFLRIQCFLQCHACISWTWSADRCCTTCRMSPMRPSLPRTDSSAKTAHEHTTRLCAKQLCPCNSFHVIATKNWVYAINHKTEHRLTPRMHVLVATTSPSHPLSPASPLTHWRNLLDSPLPQLTLQADQWPQKSQ